MLSVGASRSSERSFSSPCTAGGLDVCSVPIRDDSGDRAPSDVFKLRGGHPALSLLLRSEAGRCIQFAHIWSDSSKRRCRSRVGSASEAVVERSESIRDLEEDHESLGRLVHARSGSVDSKYVRTAGRQRLWRCVVQGE